MVAVVEHRLVDLRHLGQELEARRRLPQLLLPGLQQIPQLLPALAVAEQPRQRAEGADVQRLDPQDLPVHLLGVARVAELVLVELRHLH